VGKPVNDRQKSFVGWSIRSVLFLDSVTGWCVTDAGTVLKTTDAGQNWSIVRSYGGFLYPLQKLADVCFADASAGWAVGVDVQYSRPADPQVRRRRVHLGQQTNWGSLSALVALNGVAAVDAQRAWACGARRRVIRTRTAAPPGRSRRRA